MLGNILTDYLIDFNYQIHMIWRGVCVCVCVCVCVVCVYDRPISEYSISKLIV